MTTPLEYHYNIQIHLPATKDVSVLQRDLQEPEGAPVVNAHPEKLQNFVFRGLLLYSTFEALEGMGVNSQPAEGVDKTVLEDAISLDDFSAPIRLQAVKMAAVYQAFFCFENSVRELVEARLRESLGNDWWKKSTLRTSGVELTVAGRRSRRTAGI